MTYLRNSCISYNQFAMELQRRMEAFLARRQQQQALRVAKNNAHLTDFSSNDYLSLARNTALQERIHKQSKKLLLGSTGSRLLTGHYDLLEKLEEKVADFHQGEKALVFNSGYNANIGLLTCLPRKSDIILYDSLIHASIHDGMRQSAAQGIQFPHNNVEALEQLLIQHPNKVVFVLVESIYSMDGDAAPLVAIAQLCERYNGYLIVDEAHSTGIYGHKGEGLCVELGINKAVFARVHTFGKAIGVHGAAVVGSNLLTSYLFNYARSLIYTTALSPHTALSVLEVYTLLEQKGHLYIKELHQLIAYYKKQIKPLISNDNYIESTSPIQTIIIPGNEAVVALSKQLQNANLDVRPIRTPTVPSGTERLRICLHRHNSKEAIDQLVKLLLLHPR